MRKIFLVALGCLCFSAVFLIDQWQVTHWRAEKAVELDGVLQLCKARLLNSIESRVNTIEALASLFVSHPETGAGEFERFAFLLLASNPSIRALQYADATTLVTYVYPAKGNEITRDSPLVLLSDPLRGVFVKKAIEQRRAVLQGPFALRQGGQGIAVRLPIFSESRFTGLAIGIYDVDTLVAEAIEGVDLTQFVFRLTDNDGGVFWGGDTIRDGGLSTSFPVADVTWSLAVNFRSKPHPPVFSRLLVGICSLGFLLAALFAIHMSQKQSQRLETIVKERTKDLVQSNGALKASEEKFFKVFQNAPLLMDISSVEDGRYLEVNDDFVAVTGYSRKEAIGATCVDLGLIRAQDRQLLAERLKDNGRVQNLEIELFCSDGAKLICLYSGEVIEVNGQKQVLSIVSNITDRKKIQADRDRLLTAIEQSAEGVVITDTEGCIEYVNPSFEKITGYPQQELMGNNCRVLKSGEHDPSFYHEMWETIQSKNTWKGRLVNKRKDGSLYTEEATISPVSDKTGKIINFVAVKRDISDEIKMGKRMQQSQKMETICTLAGGIAHDFNNILFPIIGHAEMLMEDIPKDSPVRESLNEIYIGALRAKELVQQILAFSRQETSELRQVKVQDIIREALKLLRSSIPSSIDISHSIDTECGYIRADSTQIHQVVMNLATNAYHAMEETGGKLFLSLKEVQLGRYDILSPDMSQGSYVCLVISDTGVGMTKAVSEQIFDPFFTTKERGKGTGMGMSVVHGIVKNMGGAIKVYSEPGKGTQFYVYFPLDNTASEKQTPLWIDPLPVGTEHILLVDDEIAIATMEKQMLERLGYQVTSHTNSMAALNAFRSCPDAFDLVMSDLAMPNMSGDKLSAELIKIRSDIPILLCTGFSDTLSEEKMASIGIHGLILKPIVGKDLSRKIREVLNKKEAK
ncbi:MAG: PAS domain S-box protein [Proteobacteria bacterium]|nr:PAS domain S-box protein [Pseudomonadota bacterium]